HDAWIKLAGPLCDGGDYFHMGVKGEEFLLPKETHAGDIVAFLLRFHSALASGMSRRAIVRKAPLCAVLLHKLPPAPIKANIIIS
ncbi:hypothetical protein MJM45_30805, partial [Salmonella enterica subsp. enterica serovar Kentucky]|nr:hypothetical protein [Salmonella enterica subsp. enterica serovar Kentucky]